MKASDRAIKLIKHFEGLRLTEYRDTAGYRTIGYGHKILKNETFGAITELIAQSLFECDLQRLERDLEEALAVLDLSQSQYDALVSFAYNLGVGNLSNSTLLEKLQAGDNFGAADEFLRWNHAAGKIDPGLTKRREAERKLFLEVPRQE